MTQTLDQIRRKGLEALRKALGRAGMVRFLRMFSNGSGDYSKDRHAWVDSLTMDDIERWAEQKRKPEGNEKKTARKRRA